MASGKKKSSSKGRSVSGKRITTSAMPEKRSVRSDAPPSHRFAICVKNDDYPASLELRKLYPVLEDTFADQHGMIRIVDESGEGYLYPQAYFVRVELPRAVERALDKTA
jgi:hypothetical protein